MNSQQGKHTAQLHRARESMYSQRASRRLWGTVLTTLISAAGLFLTSFLNWPVQSALTPKGREIQFIISNLPFGALLLILSIPLSLALRNGLPLLRWLFLLFYMVTWYWIWPSAPEFMKNILSNPQMYPGPVLFIVSGLALLAASLMSQHSRH